MTGLYYRIWVDFIKRIQLQPAIDRQNWKIRAMMGMTLPMVFNFILIMTVLEKYVFKKYFYKIEFTFLPLRINNVLSYLVLFILPCVLINYLLIFRNKRYKKLLDRYPYYKGRLFLTYFFVSVILPIILIWIAIIFSRM